MNQTPNSNQLIDLETGAIQEIPLSGGEVTAVSASKLQINLDAAQIMEAFRIGNHLVISLVNGGQITVLQFFAFPQVGDVVDVTGAPVLVETDNKELSADTVIAVAAVAAGVYGYTIDVSPIHLSASGRRNLRFSPSYVRELTSGNPYREVIVSGDFGDRVTLDFDFGRFVRVGSATRTVGTTSSRFVVYEVENSSGYQVGRLLIERDVSIFVDRNCIEVDTGTANFTDSDGDANFDILEIYSQLTWQLEESYTSDGVTTGIQGLYDIRLPDNGPSNVTLRSQEIQEIFRGGTDSNQEIVIQGDNNDRLTLQARPNEIIKLDQAETRDGQTYTVFEIINDNNTANDTTDDVTLGRLLIDGDVLTTYPA